MSPTFAAVPVLSVLLFGLLLQIQSSFSQNFDPNVDDRDYLDTIEKRLREEAVDAHHVLINQTKVLQQVTRTFIETKIKQNLFKVVRERVEMELEEMSKNNSSTSSSVSSPNNSSRQARQDEEDDDDVGSGSTTARPRPPGLLPQLANVVTTLFGSDVNVTGYLTDATSFLPSDISSRIITAASLIDPARFTSTTTTETPKIVVNGQAIPQQVIINGTTYTYTPAAQPGVQSTNFVQNPSGVAAVAQNTNLNNNNNNNDYNEVPLQVNPATPQSQTTLTSQSSASGHQQQPGNNAEASRTGSSPQQNVHLGTSQQQQQSIGNVGSANGAVSQQQSSTAVLTDTIPNFKVNDAYIPIFPPRTTPPAVSSNEDEDEDNNSSEKTAPASASKSPQDEEDSSEDDLPLTRDDINSAAESEDDPPLGRDDAASSSIGYLDEYPIFKYGIRIFQRLTARATIPTTTEFMNTTTVERTLDSIEEEEAKATSPATSSYKQVVMSGVYLYEGAREAYQLLQHVNKFLDRISNRLDNYGYGAEEVGVEV